MALEIPGTVQVLYTDTDGSMRASSGRWEGKTQWAMGDGTVLSAIPETPPQPQYSYSGENALVHAELPMQMTTTGGQGIPMAAALEPGTQPDTQRPSLILRRAGQTPLWEIAKSCGSTMEAIRSLNGFTDEPRPGQMLLIPVC